MSYEEEHGIDKLKSIYIDKYQTTINTPLKNPSYVAYSADIELGKQFRDNYYGMTPMDQSKEQMAHNGIINQSLRGAPTAVGNILKDAGLTVSHAGAKSVAWAEKKIEQFNAESPDEFAAAQVKYNDMTNAMRDVSLEFSNNFADNMEKAGLSKTERDGLAFDFSAGAGSLAASIGIGIVGKSAKAAGAIFGLSAGRSGYEEALAKGFDPDKAFNFGVTAGVVEGSLEFIGLKALDNMAGSARLWKRLVGGSTTEFIQEFSQEGAGSVIANFFGVRDETSGEILHGAFKAGLMGAVLGGGASVMLGATRQHLEDNGVDSEEAKVLSEKIFKEAIKTDVLEEYLNIIKDEQSPLTSKDNNPDAQYKELKKSYDKASKFEEEFFDIRAKSEINALQQGFSKKESAFVGVIEQARATNMYNQSRILPSDFMEKYSVSLENKRDQIKLRQEVTGNQEEMSKVGDLRTPINIALESSSKEAAYKTFKETKLTFAEKQAFSKLYSDQGMLNDKQAFDNFYEDMQARPEIFEDPNTYNQSKDYATTESPSFVKTDKGFVKFDGSKATITMLKQGNFATLVHEMGHVFLNDQQILGNDMYKRTLKWLGSTDGKLTRAQHEKFADTFVMYLKEGKAPTENLKQMFIKFKDWLSQMYNGAKKAGITVHPTIQGVFDDIIAPSTEEIKTITQLAKKAIKQGKLEERSELKKEALEALKKFSGKEGFDSTARKAAVFAELNAGTFASSLRLVFGKEFANKANLAWELIEASNEAFEKTTEVNNIFDEAYGVKSDWRRNLLIAEMSRKNKDYQLTHGDDVIIYSKMEVISIYNQMKNSRQKEAYEFYFGKDNVEALLETLTFEDKAYADKMIPFYKRYYPKLNELFKKVKGQPLGNPENYTPVKTQSNKQFDLFDNYIQQGKSPSAIKERSEIAGLPEPVNSYNASMNYIAQAEHWLNVGEKIVKLEQVVRDLKFPVINAYGEKIYKKLLKNIDQASINGIKSNSSENEKSFNKILNNWVIAKVAINPAVTIKQLISTVNYASDVNAVDFAENFSKGVASPKKTWKYMHANSRRLTTRLARGGEDVVNRALEFSQAPGAIDSFLTSHNVDTIAAKKFLTANVRYGDIVPQVYGGYAFVQSKMKEGLSEAEAFKQYDIRSEETQQTSLSVFKTDIQNDPNAFKRVFTAFKSGIMSAMSKMVSSQVMFNRGEITAKQHAKTMAIFGAIVPAMYGAVGQIVGRAYEGFRDPEDEEDNALTKSMIKSVIMTPFNAFALVSIAANMVEQQIEYGRSFAVNLPIASEFQKGIQGLAKKDTEMLPLIAAIIEPILALPIQTSLRIFDKAMDKEKKKKKRKMRVI